MTSAQTKALQSAQADPLPVLIAQVTEQLRGSVGFRTPALLDATAGTLPPNLVPDAIGEIIRRLKMRLNKTLNDDERIAASGYRKLLAALNAGEWPVDAPLNSMPATAQPVTIITGASAGIGAALAPEYFPRLRSAPTAEIHGTSLEFFVE